MTQISTYRQQFTDRKICVLIPTYNNSGTLGKVIEEVLTYTSHVIVVNDGSTDRTPEILEQFPQVAVVSYSPNKGKGIALRTGFKYAVSQGYDYAITIDADGQHFPDDLPVFLKKVVEEPNAIIIGARNLQQENMPGKNTFANKFSNFWFYVETGLKLPDTQSGFRLYPLHAMKGMRFFCNKYEFEIEVMVKSSWRGIKVLPAAVKVYYPPAEERVSHFRPFKDFSRIGVLNTVLVTIALAYIHPRNFFRYIFTKGNFKKMLQEHLFNKEESTSRKALSIGFGVFMGIIPIWGFQMLAALALATLFRLNRALVIVAANISIPPCIPVIVYLSFLMGRFWVKEDATWVLFKKDLNLGDIYQNLFQYITGSITLAVVAGLLAWVITYGLLAAFRKKRPAVI
jgi:glycosyltransferase involved in cell wall biosynthesis